MSRNDELLSVVQRYLDSGANDDDDEEELGGMTDSTFEGRPERHLFKISDVKPAEAPLWSAGSALPLATKLAYGQEGFQRDDGFGQGGNFNALASAPQAPFAPPLATAAAACLVLEVDISGAVWPNAPTQLDLVDVLGGGALKATACTVGQLKQYIAAHALRAQQQAWEQQSQMLPRGSARVAPAPELSQVALAASLVMEPLISDDNGDEAGGCLHDHVPLWEAPTRSSSRLNNASSSSRSCERDPTTGLWRGVVAVRSRAESSAEGQVRRFERFANRRAFSSSSSRRGGATGRGFGGSGGDREEVERPEETFHDALERFDLALLELNDGAAEGSPEQESGQQAAVATFLEECLAECKTRFELVDRELPAGATAAAALASHACGATATSSGSSSGSSGWGDKGSGADEKVSKLAGALADEYATWQLLALLHYHKLLLRDDDDVSRKDNGGDSDDPTAALWLTDKEVVRQVTTLEDDDDEAARTWPQLPRRTYPCDPALLRCCVARRWLEGTFAATADFYGWSKQPFSVHQASQWARTQKALQDSAQAAASSSSSTLLSWAGAGAGAGAAASGVQVDSLDPDAPMRGCGSGRGGWRALASGDASEERDLCLDVWRLVRSGDLQAAVQTCASRGSSWRAALLSGGELHGSGPCGTGPGSGSGQEGSEDDGSSSLEGAYQQLFELGLLREGAAAAALNDFSGGGDSSSASSEWAAMECAGWASEGNPRRALWLRTCWALGRSFTESAAATAAAAPATAVGCSSSGSGGGVNSKSADAAVATVEGATLSALCGDVGGVLASPLVSDSARAWENQLWALFKAMECAGVQSHLSKHHRAQRELGGSNLWPCVDSDLAADLDEDESGDWARALDASSSGGAVAASPFGGSGGSGGNAAGNLFGSPGGGFAFGASYSSSTSSLEKSSGKSLQANNSDDEAVHLSLVQRSLTAAAAASAAQRAPAAAPSAAPSTVLTPSQVFASVGWHASDKSTLGNSGNSSRGGVNVHRQAQAAALMGARGLAALLLPSSASTAAAPALVPPPAAAPFTFGALSPPPAVAPASVGGSAKLEAFAGALAVTEASPPYDKRFGAHLAIALRTLGFCAGNAVAQERVDALVELYVQHLVRLGRPRLVALYCKHIHQRRRRVDNYVKLLATVKERSARVLCVQLAKQWFPNDLADVTRKAVELARQQGTGEGDMGEIGEQEKGDTTAALALGFGGTPGGRGASGGGALALQANSAANADGLALGVGSLQLVEYGGLSSGLVSTSGLSSSSSGGGGLSAGDLAKIKAIEWLCIDDNHKAEAIAQANELLRGFFLGPKATAALASSSSDPCTASSSSPPWAWRCDAAEILLASRGLGDDDVPRAFPTQVLAALESALIADDEGIHLGGDSGSGGSSGRAAAEWARVLKEHQGWRVLLRAVQAVNEWRTAMAAASTPPQAASSDLQLQQPPSSSAQQAAWGSPGLHQQQQRRRGGGGGGGGASAMDAEERRYAAQRDGVRYAQATDAWLNDALATLLQGALPCAAQALEAVLDFQPTPRCYGVSNSGGPGGGEGDADADVYRVVDSLTRCEVHPAGWMLFEKDYLAPSDAANINKRTLAEAEASDASNTFGASGSAFSGGASFSELGSSSSGGGGGRAAASERARRIATAQRQAADSRASIAIRRAVLPVCLMLLHEVHHATAAWLLGAAKTSAAASTYAGSGGSSSGGGGQVEGLQRLAATEFRRALQVADLAAARQHALYACLDGDALRKLLAACHASSMELLDLTGGLEME